MKYSHIIEETAKAIYYADPEEGDWGEESEANRETYYRYAVAAALAMRQMLSEAAAADD